MVIYTIFRTGSKGSLMAKKKRGKPAKKKPHAVVAMRGCLTVIAELCGVAGFLLALYIFLKEYL
jgi:hypothetical protein